MAEEEKKKEGVAEKTGDVIGGAAQKGAGIIKGFGKGLSKGFKKDEKKE